MNPAYLSLPLLLAMCEPGGAIITHGQSNSVAAMNFTVGNYSAAVYSSQKVQTWNNTEWAQADPDARGDAYPGGIGQWAGVLGSKLKAARFYVGGRGGMPISFFLPDDTTETPNNYQRLLTQVSNGGTPPAALIWWQGESDTSVWGNTSAENYLAALETLYTAWRSDFPTIVRFVLVRIANPACGGNSSAVLSACDQFLAAHPEWREVDLQDLTGDQSYHDGCHYRLPGYRIAAERIYEAMQ